MRFKRFTFSLLSPLIGFHYGRNPVSGQRFLHIAPLPFVGIDFELGTNLNKRASDIILTADQLLGLPAGRYEVRGEAADLLLGREIERVQRKNKPR